jgi:hypothetical protein
MYLYKRSPLILLLLLVCSCNSSDEDTTPTATTEAENCITDQVLNDARGDCGVSLVFTSQFQDVE